VALPSTPATDSASDDERACPVCKEKFEHVFNHDDDEGAWHYKNALRVEDRIFHPLCYEDHKKRSEKDKNAKVRTT
jgi:pre-mRNA cleavage complex 2 protein Pcf11